MAKKTKSLTANYIAPVIHYMETRYHFNTQPLLEELKIKQNRLSSNHYFLTIEQYTRFIGEVLSITNREPLIAYLISTQNISQHGLLGLLALCSLSLKTAINAFIRFYQLRTHLFTFEYSNDDQYAYIRFKETTDLGNTHDFTIEMTLATIQNAKQQIVNLPKTDDLLSVTHANPNEHTEFDIFEGKLQYNQAYNQIAFPLSQLDEKIKTSHQATFQELQQQCETLLSTVKPETDVVIKLQQLLEQSDTPLFTLDESAALLAMSSRSLSRKLQHAHTNFQALIDHERIRRAKKLLLETDLSITDISAELSFSDSSHFSKVFKRQAQQSPSEYRKSN